jgi:hypothetical protein
MRRPELLAWSVVGLSLATILGTLRAGYDDPSAVASATSTITAPADGIRVPLGPMPGPVPGAVLKLTSETIYVIDSDVPVRVLASPDRLVRVVRESGPLRVRGRFIDGAGKIETRNLVGKFLYFVEPVNNGRVELLVIPTGEAKPDDSDVIRRVLDVDAGQGPQPPPPDPDPDPKPKPDPDPPAPKAELVWVVVVEETSMRTPDIARVLNDTGYWNGLKAKGHLIRFYDRDSEEARKSGYVKRADSVGLPAVILYDQKQGNHLKTFRMTSTAAIDSELKAVTK